MKLYNNKNIFYLLILIALVFTACKKNITSDENPTPPIEEPEPSSNIPKNILYRVDSIGKNVQFFKSTYSSLKWAEKMHVHWRPSALLPTGFFLYPKQVLKVHVALTSGNALPIIQIGTPSFQENYAPANYILTNGDNTITSTQGGIIWVIFQEDNPNTECKVTFNSGNSIMPFWIKNKTTRAEWEERLEKSTMHEILLIGNRVQMVAPRNLHDKMTTQDNDIVIDQSDFVMTKVEEYAGFDGINYDHKTHPAPHLMVAAPIRGATRANATHDRTAYMSVAKSVFSENVTDDNSLWTIAHEMGNMNQQNSWFWEGLTDVTSDLLSLYVTNIYDSKQAGHDVESRYNAWIEVFLFFDNASPNKSYDNIGNKNVKVGMFHQLTLAYGDSFYTKLHRLVREDNGTYIDNDAKKRNFILKSCQISGHDLSKFFKKWALLADNDIIYTDIKKLKLPTPAIDPHLLPYNTKPSLENGAIYQIESVLDTNVLLTVSNKKLNNNALVQIWARNVPATDNQSFLARILSDGKIVFKSMTDTTKVLDIAEEIVKGTPLFINEFKNGTPSQQWITYALESNEVTVRSPLSDNAFLDVNKGSTANGTKVHIWTNNNSKGQRFIFKKIGEVK